jgi:hypothetical protein
VEVPFQWTRAYLVALVIGPGGCLAVLMSATAIVMGSSVQNLHGLQ